MSQAGHTLGARGETRAAAYLEERGYRILARNTRSGGVELDIVASRGATLVFVEVKTRRSRAQGTPLLAVDFRKRVRIVRGAAAWLRERGWRGKAVRFDVIACEPHAEHEWRITHVEAAFDASDARR